jgi:hypothetical protein
MDGAVHSICTYNAAQAPRLETRDRNRARLAPEGQPVDTTEGRVGLHAAARQRRRLIAPESELTLELRLAPQGATAAAAQCARECFREGLRHKQDRALNLAVGVSLGGDPHSNAPLVQPLGRIGPIRPASVSKRCHSRPRA